MNYHDGEDRPDEGSDQRDMRRWDLEVLIPGEWNKGDENPEPIFRFKVKRSAKSIQTSLVYWPCASKDLQPRAGIALENLE